MSDRELPPQVNEFAGIWDDIETAKKWRPVLQLIREVEKGTMTAQRLVAVRNLVSFVIKTAFNADPYSKQSFLLFCLIVDLAQKDIRVRAAIERLMK